MAHNTEAPTTVSKTVAIIGCGKLGTALLTGILDSLKNSQNAAVDYRFIACVSSGKSYDRLQSQFNDPQDNVLVLTNDNSRGAEAADVVVLGCKPYQYQEILSCPRLRKALRGKILLSMLGGVSAGQLSHWVNRETEEGEACLVSRAVPNIAASLRKATTVIERSEIATHETAERTAVELFARVGRVKVLPAEQMEAGIVVSASSLAFFAAIAAEMAQSSILKAFDPAAASELTAASMWSTAHLVFSGKTPSEIRNGIATPGGSTAHGLNHLERSGVMKIVSEALEATFEATKGLSARKP